VTHSGDYWKKDIWRNSNDAQKTCEQNPGKVYSLFRIPGIDMEM
jgi:hypothetical protein